MKQTIIKRYSGTPFSISCESVENKPGTWNSTKISIFRGEDQIGEYLRNYSSAGPETFYPFLQDGQWFALYSANYTALRVMKLHELTIEDWSGDVAKGNGFCPTEVYIPKYNTTVDKYGDGREMECYYVDSDYEEQEFIDQTKQEDYRHTTYCNFGFLSGCIWGDDSSWKIRYIDLKNIENAPFTITEKFGYWEMPQNLKLKQCVNLDGWEPDMPFLRLTGMQTFNLRDK